MFTHSPGSSSLCDGFDCHVHAAKIKLDTDKFQGDDDVVQLSTSSITSDLSDGIKQYHHLEEVRTSSDSEMTTNSDSKVQQLQTNEKPKMKKKEEESFCSK